MRNLLVAGLGLALLGLGAPEAVRAHADDVQDLIKQLKSEDKAARLKAAWELGNLGTAAKPAVPALAKLLREDKEKDVRTYAGQALAQIGPAAVPVLAEALKDADVGVRYRAARALGLVGPDAKAAVPALVEALKDRDDKVQAMAAYALGEMGEDAQPAAVALGKALRDRSADVRVKAAVALQQIGPAAVPPLCDCLRDEDKAVRAEAAQTLAVLGPGAKEAVAALRGALKDKEPSVREAAAAALGAIGPGAREALPDLFQTLDDKQLGVQVQALNALFAIGSSDTAGFLDALREANAKFRWAGPFVLAQFGPQARDAVPHLQNALKDKDAGVRLGAAIALGQVGKDAKPAMPALAQIAKQDVSPQVRAAATTALARLDTAWQEAAQKALDQVAAQVRNAQVDQRAQTAFAGAQARALQPQPPANRLAMADPKTQERFDQIVNQHVLATVFVAKGFGDHNALQSQTQKLVMAFPPEAVPALVRGVNLTAIYGVGGC